MDDNVSSIVLLVGLAVGVDYTLFYLRREREERRQGRQQARGDPHRRRDLRPRRPRLRLHRDGRDGRHVPRRRPDVHRARRRRDHGRRRRHDRLGHRRAGDARRGSATASRRAACPFLHRLRRADGESRVWDCGPGHASSSARPLSAVAGRRRAARAGAARRFGMHTVLTGTDDLPRKLAVMKVYDRMQAAFPGGQIPAVVTIEAKDVTTPQIAGRDQGARATSAVATGTMNGPRRRRSARTSTSRSIVDPDAGQRHRRRRPAARSPRCAAASSHSTVGSAPGVQHAYVTGIAAGTKDFNDLMKAQRADRVRLRAVAGVPAAAGDLPLDRHPDQGDRAEPAVGRRRLRRS